MRDRPSGDTVETVESLWPRAWRLLIIATCTLILCSCRGPAMSEHGGSTLDQANLGPRGYATLPETAYAGPIASEPACPPLGPPGMEQGVPLAYEPVGPWTPPGISPPWPRDEYLRDGGDGGSPAGVTKEWEVRGLEPEDAIVHYDTLDGRRVVEPTNRVVIYSPRFGAVRQVVGLVAEEQHQRAAGVDLPTALATPRTTQIVTSSKQNLQAQGQIGARRLELVESKLGDGAMSGTIKAKGFDNGTLPYETDRLIRDGVVESTDAVFLARGAAAAVAWSHDLAVQVLLDRQVAAAEKGVQSVGTVYAVGESPGVPRLRVVKVASTQVAKPGDEVDFTIRFDNVGSQAIGNVTIIDNLTTRLEYVADSAQCSLDATFSTQPNAGGSLVVRCEITDPIEPGNGGVVRFRCRVR